MLFNIGSLYSELATLENFESNDGIKNAGRFFRVGNSPAVNDIFQLACGSFEKLKTFLEDCPEAAVSADLSSDSLKMFSLLMLAQAQELFYLMVLQSSHLLTCSGRKR